jgi:hypothetical protein
MHPSDYQAESAVYAVLSALPAGGVLGAEDIRARVAARTGTGPWPALVIERALRHLRSCALARHVGGGRYASSGCAPGYADVAALTWPSRSVPCRGGDSEDLEAQALAAAYLYFGDDAILDLHPVYTVRGPDADGDLTADIIVRRLPGITPEGASC